jgi:cyclopropane-fatty-acyl-phospholipid synthase
MGAAAPTVAEVLRPVLRRVAAYELPIVIGFWDGSEIASTSSSARIAFRSPTALRRLLWSPGELGLARAYVAGELELDGDIYAALDLHDALAGGRERVENRLGLAGRLAVLRAAARVGALGRNPPPPPEEVHLRGRLHSKARDAAAVSHHYDISNEFYRLVLGPTMTYSCAYFEQPGATLEDAQCAKYDLICRKLGLAPGMRLLDVGCGWGGMVMHAAEHYGVEAVGITISSRQAELAAKRVAEAGLAGRVEIRLEDYRDVADGPYDAISSIGMFEHVGSRRIREYLADLRDLLRPEGRLLNHAISRPAPAARHRTRFPRDSFVNRYVFPDGELHEVGSVVSSLQGCGFEVRDVESIREHYVSTLRAWVANLETAWDRAVELVGSGRARVWRLYMAASAANFEANRTSIHQVLAVRTAQGGGSGMPATRGWILRPPRDARLAHG